MAINPFDAAFFAANPQPPYVVLQGTADGAHTTQKFHLVETPGQPQTFELPFTGTRSDGGNTYVRVSAWATISGVQVESATVEFSTESGTHAATAHATGPTELSTDLFLNQSIYSGFLHLALDDATDVAFASGDDYYARWADGDYSQVTGTLTVTVHPT